MSNNAGGMYTDAQIPMEVAPRHLHPRPENYYWWNDFKVPEPAVYRLEGNEE